jgi:MraZ protein
MQRIIKLNEIIDNLDPYSEARDAFATTILGGSLQLPFDSEGRVLLPENLLIAAKLEDQACFVGKGATFEIWNPTLFEAYLARAKAIAKEKRSSLSIAPSS